MIKIIGEINGQEDLIIDGNIEGSINLREHSVTIGRTGKIKSTITARAVVVAGEVRGDVRATERIILNSTARLIGDLRAPKVQLDEGCQFKGGIEMDDKSLSSGMPPADSLRGRSSFKPIDSPLNKPAGHEPPVPPNVKSGGK